MNKTKEILITGFALFSLFFGAGNLLLPPLLGYNAGSNWMWVTIGFMITAFPLNVTSPTSADPLPLVIELAIAESSPKFIVAPPIKFNVPPFESIFVFNVVQCMVPTVFVFKCTEILCCNQFFIFLA